MTTAGTAIGINATRWRDSFEFKDHVDIWAERIGVKPKRVQMQKMHRKWASCSAAVDTA